VVSGLLAMPLQLPAILLLTPWVRPFRWSRLVFTYALPLIPLLVLVDGTVSMLRLYLEDELRELVASIPGHEGFAWDIGSTPIPGAPVGLTHPRIGHSPRSSRGRVHLLMAVDDAASHRGRRLAPGWGNSGVGVRPVLEV
jgi:hypothetical protein